MELSRSQIDSSRQVSNIQGIAHTQALEQALERLQQAEAALQESEARFDRFVQGSQDGFWDWDIAAN